MEFRFFIGNRDFFKWNSDFKNIHVSFNQNMQNVKKRKKKISHLLETSEFHLKKSEFQLK